MCNGDQKVSSLTKYYNQGHSNHLQQFLTTLKQPNCNLPIYIAVTSSPILQLHCISEIKILLKIVNKNGQKKQLVTVYKHCSKKKKEGNDSGKPKRIKFGLYLKGGGRQLWPYSHVLQYFFKKLISWTNVLLTSFWPYLTHKLT